MLHLLGELKRNTVAKQRVVEFGGPSVGQLGIDSRFALSNMTTEFGGIAGVFPADEQTAAFMQKRYKSKRRHITIGEVRVDVLVDKRCVFARACLECINIF